MITKDVTYISEFPVELWRAGSENDPDFHKLRLPPRPPGKSVDIIPYPHPVTKEPWVRALSGGASTFDGPHPEFRRGWWWIVPKGTAIPLGLAITKQSYNPKTGVTHYTVAPGKDMPLKEFIDLLKNLKAAARRSHAIGAP